eukprot:symbB.v1.2.038425.t1/scaffold5975.1/size22001/2
MKGVISSAEASHVGGKASVPPVILHILAFKACRRAIKFGDHLNEVQMRRLMKELSKCDFPFQCAHGRPTVYPLASLAQLENRGRLTSTSSTACAWRSLMVTAATLLVLGLVVKLATSQEILFLEDPHSERQVKVSNLQGVEQTWWFDKKLRIPGAEGTSICRRLRGFVSPMVLQRLRELIGPHSQMRYATGRDSVDEMVTFEYYPMTNSTWQNEEVGHVLKDVLEDVVLPYVRETYACETCVVGEILIRRYLPEERRTHNLHFDSHAFATVVLGLTSPEA